MEDKIISVKNKRKDNNTILLGIIAILIVFNIFVSLNRITGNPVLQEEQSILNKVKQERIIRVGYVEYPPYVIKDPKTGELSGYSIDIIREIASQMNVKIEFVEGSWQTYISDLQNEKFDLQVGPLYNTISRSMEIDFSEPYGYFSGVAAIVKKDETRFVNFEDFNKKSLIITVPQGWSVQEYAEKNLPNANIKVFKQEGAALVISNVLTGNADVALVDGITAQQYLENNPNQPVKALFLDVPIVINPAGFGVRKGDQEWLRFLDASIKNLKTDGTLSSISKKYALYSYDIKNEYIPQ